MFTFLEGTNFSEDFDEALDKLSSINVGGNQQHLTRDMDRKFMNIAEHTKDHTDQSEIIDDIITPFYTKILPKPFMQKLELESKRTILSIYPCYIPSRIVSYLPGMSMLNK